MRRGRPSTSDGIRINAGGAPEAMAEALRAEADELLNAILCLTRGGYVPNIGGLWEDVKRMSPPALTLLSKLEAAAAAAEARPTPKEETA